MILIVWILLFYLIFHIDLEKFLHELQTQLDLATHSEAQANCEKKNANLAIIRSLGQNTIMEKMIGNFVYKIEII